MKVSKNSMYQTHEKPKRRNWRAKRGILSHFLTSIVAKHQKIEGGTLWGEKVFFPKNLTMPKKLKGGLFCLSRYGMLRVKREKTFLVQFARPNDSMWDHKIL